MLLPYKLDYQDTSYWCGPSSTRAVLVTRGIDVSEPILAQAEATTTDGTMRYQIVEELTARLGVAYVDQPLNGTNATAAEADLMRQRITATINAGYGTVVNVVGFAYDVLGTKHSYTGHYIAVVGVETDTAVIMDPAIAKAYSMTWQALATWAAQRGYLYIPNPPTATVEDDMDYIEEKATGTTYACPPGLVDGRRPAIPLTGDRWNGGAHMAGGGKVTKVDKLDPGVFLVLAINASWPPASIGGTVDVAAIAKAVNDELARRQAS